ncbi:hypothetical protein CYMTET_7857 [Cymbomonas tetramitiformis]|uniref:EF-hand domain-containing protein n=1 Tax=Cymbomonas tetramitiformis TaxID=36881 RepID=A0AAE0GUB4_9CHLO|nr:hypothetical protein CYMTET_7857 [Cymbomonas tetramitiformis]
MPDETRESDMNYLEGMTEAEERAEAERKLLVQQASLATANQVDDSIYVQKTVMEIHIHSDLEEECFLVPAQHVISAKERARVYNHIDLVGKGFLGRADIYELLSHNRAATNDFMAQFDPSGDGVITREEFWDVIELAISKLRPLSTCERVYLTFANQTSSKLAYHASVVIMLLIVVSSVNFILETLPQFNYTDEDDPSAEPKPHYLFFYIECVCIAVFTVEYCARLFTVWAVRDWSEYCMKLETVNRRRVSICVGDQLVMQIDQKLKKLSSQRSVKLSSSEGSVARTEKSGLVKLIEFSTDVMNIVDFVAIAPFYVEVGAGAGAGGLSFLRVLRLARVFRIFKMGKYNQGMQLFGQVIKQSLPAMYILGFFALLGTILFGSMIFFAEAGDWTFNTDYPDGAYIRPNVLGDGDEKTPFTSIPSSFWWVLVTSTTVGYGDYYPTTAAGKLVGTICMLSGVLVLALPITIIGANFANEYANVEEQKKRTLQEATLRNSREKCWREGRYEELLRQGVIDVPDVPEEVQQEWRNLASIRMSQDQDPVRKEPAKKSDIGQKDPDLSKQNERRRELLDTANRLSVRLLDKAKLSQARGPLSSEIKKITQLLNDHGKLPWGGRCELALSLVLGALATEPEKEAEEFRVEFLEFLFAATQISQVSPREMRLKHCVPSQL